MKESITQVGESQDVQMRLTTDKSEKSARADWAEEFAQAMAEAGEDDASEFADWNEADLTDFDETEW